jgi:hypothetical protein
LSAPRPLYVEEVDFVLKQLNYRFNADSLSHHLRGYTDNRWGLRFKMDGWNQVSVNAGRDGHLWVSTVRCHRVEVAATRIEQTGAACRLPRLAGPATVR